MTDPNTGPPGAFAKRHVSGMMKHLKTDEDREAALQAQAKFRKMFEDRKWEPVMTKIQAVVDEDHLRIVDPPSHTIKQACNRRLAAGLSAPAKASSITATILTRLRSPVTPRERWDMLKRSPATPPTPLSPTPTGNAFGGGGFWGGESPRTPMTPMSPSPLRSVPVSAGESEPEAVTSEGPRDERSRVIYEQVKKDIDDMARMICGRRVSMPSMFSGSSDSVPDSLVRPRDVVKAAELILELGEVDLEPAINPSLPGTLHAIGESEKWMLRRHAGKYVARIKHSMDWYDQNLAPKDGSTVCHKQRESWEQNACGVKAGFLQISDNALRQAWGVKILEDMQRVVEEEGDDDEEDDGYDYSNFLRSIKREISAESELEGMLDEGSEDANTLALTASFTGSLGEDKRSSCPLSLPRSSINTIASLNKPLQRLREASPSTTSITPPEKRSRTTALANTRGLRIITDRKSDTKYHIPIATPEIMFARAKAVSSMAADDWERDLEGMVKRTRVGSTQQIEDEDNALDADDVHPLLRTERNARLSGSSGSEGSWLCEGAVACEKRLLKRTVDSVELRMADGNGAKKVCNSEVLDTEEHSLQSTAIPPSSPAQTISPSRIPQPSAGTQRSFQRSPTSSTLSATSPNRTAQDTQLYAGPDTPQPDSPKKSAEDEWLDELHRMEVKEHSRQVSERERYGGC